MKGIKLKYTEQEKDLINSSILEGNKMGEIIEKVLKISPNRTSDAVFHIVRKIRNQLKEENAIASKSMYFYTDEQIKTLIDAINSGESLLQIAKRLHTSFNRTEHNLYVKLMKLNHTHKNVVNNKDKKKLVFYTKEQISEMTSMLQSGNISVIELSKQLSVKYNKSIYSLRFKLNVLKKKLKLTKTTRVEPVRTLATIRAKKVLQDNQQPAEVGVEVPHGMTFEGKPKRIMLHSDHFRIYF
jgi:hypothetical protein